MRHVFFIIGILLITMGCNKDQESENLLYKNVTETKDGEMHWNTDARMATIYALQYSYTAINPEFTIEPESKQLPIFIDGKEALEYIDLDKTFYSSEEQEFIKEQLYKQGSRAVLMKNIPHKNGTQIGNIVYVPYETDLKVPERFTNKFGAFLDNFEEECEWRVVEMGEYGGTNCYCHYLYLCDYSYGFCFSCPEGWDDFRNILEVLNVHSDLIDTPINAFKEPLMINEVPLGESILRH